MYRQQLMNKISIVQWCLRDKIRRYREALAYAPNRMDTMQANDIIYKLPGRRGLVSARNAVGRQLPDDRARLLLG